MFDGIKTSLRSVRREKPAIESRCVSLSVSFLRCSVMPSLHKFVCFRIQWTFRTLTQRNIMAAVPKKIADRLVAGIKHFQPILSAAEARESKRKTSRMRSNISRSCIVIACLLFYSALPAEAKNVRHSRSEVAGKISSINQRSGQAKTHKATKHKAAKHTVTKHKRHHGSTTALK